MAQAISQSVPARHRALVVDDSALVRRAVENCLAEANIEVHLAANGEDAFELALRTPFDIIVTDVTMGAVSGVHLCRMLRAEPRTAKLPIVLLTADDDPRSRFWGRSAGADAYIAKSEMRGALKAAVCEILEGHPAQETPAFPDSPEHVDPLGRMSKVLDEQLFQAVVMSRVFELTDHIQDRRAFLRHAAELFGEVLGCAYVALHLPGAEDSWTMVARGAWPQKPSREDLAEFGISPEARLERTKRIEDRRLKNAAVEAGDAHHVPISAGGVTIGMLNIFSGPRARLAARDKETAALLARALGGVLNSLLLLEATRRMATTDALTQLANRGHGSQRLEQEIARARRYGPPLGVALLDVDHFKAVNDTFGHAIGDEVLRRIAAAIEEAARTTDIAIRWGGEEFLVIFPRTDFAGAEVGAERLRAAIENIEPIANGPQSLSVSVGVTAFGLDDDPDRLVDRADRALYAAKSGGRNRVVAYAIPSSAPAT